MQIILENPYRIVGLLAGATAREQERQIKRLKQYIDAEQNVEDDFSFTRLGSLRRTLDDVTVAASKLNLDSDKMSAALFWFWNENPITDEAAFDALKDGDIDTAFQIWDKLITETKEDGKRFWKPVTEKNYSAFHNYFVINILKVNGNLHNAIVCNLYFLESDLVHKFISSVTDETYKITKKELQLLFLTLVQSEIEKNKKLTSNKLIDILNKQKFSAKEDFLNFFVQKPIEQIEKKIGETRKSQRANPEKAGEFGNDLFKSTQNLLSSIIGVLGKSDVRIMSISDKLANEILQCSINVFNHFHETDTEVGEIALELNEKAESIAIGSVIKERINESTAIVEKYISDRPEREKKKKIESDLASLIEVFNNYENRSDTIHRAKMLMAESTPKLNSIKNILGSSDDLYLKLSTRVAAIAQHNVIEEVNAAQENIQVQMMIDRIGTINKLKIVLKNAWGASLSIGSLDMETDFRINRYDPNRDALKGLCTQLGVSTSLYTSSPSSNSSTRNTLTLSPRTPSTTSSTKPSTTSKNSSWASENTGCIWVIVIGAIILIISIISNS